MAKHNLFAEKAGMKKVLEQKSSKEALRIAEALSILGFDLKLLSSPKKVTDNLQNLSTIQLTELKEAFMRMIIRVSEGNLQLIVTRLMALRRLTLKA